MHLEWTLPALRDFKEAGDFIALDNPQAAKRMADRVQEAVDWQDETECINCGQERKAHSKEGNCPTSIE